MPKKLAQIFHFDSYGKRQEKYKRLNNTEFQDVDWKELELKEPYYFFVPKDFELEEKYNESFSVNEIFKEFNSGIQTKNDKLSVQFEKKNLENIVCDFQQLSENELAEKYNLKNTSGWNIQNAKNDILNNKILYTHILYKPFDLRNTIYTGKSGGFIGRPRDSQSRYMLKNNNALYLMRNLTGTTNLTTIFIGNSFCDINFYGYQTYFFPLYLYQPNPLEGKEEKIPNFHEETIKKIEKKLNLKLDKDFSPEDLFDYIYAVLHSKTYRDTYKEFLKIDFPKIPFDVNKTIFLKMRDLGRELRSYHLMENESLIPKNFITKYEINGENEVEKITYKNEKVFINDSQYFEGVPKEVWEFYIGGYQPAQKWLKDRKERKLTYEDILHYSKIILCLQKTISIMEQIESIFQIK